LAQVHRNPQMVDMLRNLHHRVVETGRDFEGKDRSGIDIADCIKSYWLEWRQTSLPDSGLKSPYTTQSAVDALRSFVATSSPRVTSSAGSGQA